jgi:hypothetical protein
MNAPLDFCEAVRAHLLLNRPAQWEETMEIRAMQDAAPVERPFVVCTALENDGPHPRVRLMEVEIQLHAREMADEALPDAAPFLDAVAAVWPDPAFSAALELMGYKLIKILPRPAGWERDGASRALNVTSAWRVHLREI